MAGSALKLTVRRKAAELVAPARPTPRELKRLSDIDDQGMLRHHIPVIHFYRHGAAMDGKDPAVLVRSAISRALVHYYPLAGRLRGLECRKLAVDCTGEGVLFVEADADVRLDDFGGDALSPPFPGIEELLFDVPGSSELLGTPLLLFQVTRLACGGFVLAARLMHAMADAYGLTQFLGAVAELARGAAEPTVRPVWGRELLDARRPPRPAFAHREYDELEPDTFMPLDDDIVHRSFFFGAQEVAAIRSHLAPGLRKSATTFEVLAGCLWKCRTGAADADPNMETRMMCAVNARRRKSNIAAIPSGYYGNALAFPVAVSTAGELRASPVGYAVELVKRAKEQVHMEYMRSVADLMVLRRRPVFTLVRTYVVTDLTRAGFGDIDFGWGAPVYGGPAINQIWGSFLLPFKGRGKGQDGIVVPICLPALSMDKFVEEIGKLLRPATIVTKPAL